MQRETDSAAARAFKCFAYRAAVIGALAGVVTACGGGGGTTRPTMPETPADPAPANPAPADPAPANPAPETPPANPAPETPANPTPAPTPAMPEIPITRPAPDVPGTRANAVVVAAGATTNSSISAADDVDYFRLNLPRDRGNTVTIWTTGAANTALRLEDGDGRSIGRFVAVPSTTSVLAGPRAASTGVSPLGVIANSGGAVSVTTDLDHVFARAEGRDGSTGDYALHNRVAENLAPRVVRAFTGVSIPAGGSPVTVDLSSFFEDPEEQPLTFSATFGAGQVGPVSLGITVTGSILNIASPAGIQPGPVSITVKASDPLMRFIEASLTVTVTPAASPPDPQSNDLNGCVSPRLEQSGSPPGAFGGASCGYTIRAVMTNRCSIEIDVSSRFRAPSLNSDWNGANLFISPGETKTDFVVCQSVTTLPYRYCVQPGRDSDLPAAANRCYRDPIPWRQL